MFPFCVLFYYTPVFLLLATLNLAADEQIIDIDLSKSTEENAIIDIDVSKPQSSLPNTPKEPQSLVKLLETDRPTGLKLLDSYFRSDNARLKIYALKVAIFTKAPRQTYYHMLALQDQNKDVRSQAFSRLPRIDHLEQAIHIVDSLAQEENPQIRRSAAKKLRQELRKPSSKDFRIEFRAYLQQKAKVRKGRYREIQNIVFR